MGVRTGWWTRSSRARSTPRTSPTVDAPPWLAPGAADIDPNAPTQAADIERTPPEPDGEPPGHPPVPPLRRIEQFVLLERIGAGGMGEVFAAFDDKLERKVAIKLVATRTSTDRARQRLLREAQALARLSHPNVVTVYEVGALPDGGLFIAMELVKGKTLRAWQRAQPREWREIVATYAEAGRGLAAAHQTGIVHRDFKPDNVLVGDDGRVRVADFGLAFAAHTADDPMTEATDGEPRPGAPMPRLTAAGRFAGTPGYMAPEQLAGAAIDARADQFSFCIALREALEGERPTAAEAPAAPSARRGDAERAYPRWLGQLVQRGLAHDPDERFATMDALLTELTRRTERRGRAVAIAGTGALAATLAIATVLSGRGEPPPCPPATAELAGVWDGPTRLRSQTAILATGAAFAPIAWASTAAAFDRYAERWLAAQQSACEATHVRHVQSAALLDRRMECMASRRRALAAAAELLQRRPAQAVGHAGELLTSLGDIELCADTAVLLEQPGPATPASAPARTRAAAVRERLASAAALLATGDVAGAEPVVADAEQRATGLDDSAVRAELLAAQGEVVLARGEVAPAIQAFDRAIELAVASHHDELIADIWLRLAMTAGGLEQRPAQIETWLGNAEAWLRRLGHTADSRWIQADRARANLQRTGSDARAAVATLTQAIERGEALWGKTDPRLIPLLRDRASALGGLRQARPAVADAERALALGVAAWGPEYPDIARTRRALGLLYVEQLGEVARGERELIQAIELYRRQLGADSIEVANCEQALSEAGQYRGDYAAALDHAERAERIYARRLGPEHPRRGEALMGVGALRLLRKDLDGSLAADQAAYPILRAALGPTHTTVGLLLSNTGETLLALGRADAARADFAQALEILERNLGPRQSDLALPLKGLGLACLRAGQPRDALPPLERALSLSVASATAGGPQELAEIRWGLARALHATGGDPVRAHALAVAALAGYRGLGGESQDRVTEIERWLAAP